MQTKLQVDVVSLAMHLNLVPRTELGGGGGLDWLILVWYFIRATPILRWSWKVYVENYTPFMQAAPLLAEGLGHGGYASPQDVAVMLKGVCNNICASDHSHT